MEVWTFRRTKSIFIILSVVGVTAILSVLQYIIHYYNYPVEEEINYTAIECIIWDRKGAEWEKVDVEVRGKRLHYIFHNQRDAVQGDILVNGYSIFGNIDHSDEYMGFYTECHGEGFGCVRTRGDYVSCEIIALSEDFQAIVCGIYTAPSGSGEEGAKQERQALLVIPGNDIGSAKEIIKNASQHSGQMDDWLLENGWNELIGIN